MFWVSDGARDRDRHFRGSLSCQRAQAVDWCQQNPYPFVFHCGVFLVDCIENLQPSASRLYFLQLKCWFTILSDWGMVQSSDFVRWTDGDMLVFAESSTLPICGSLHVNSFAGMPRWGSHIYCVSVLEMHNHLQSYSLGCLRWSSYYTFAQSLDRDREEQREGGGQCKPNVWVKGGNSECSCTTVQKPESYYTSHCKG